MLHRTYFSSWGKIWEAKTVLYSKPFSAFVHFLKSSINDSNGLIKSLCCGIYCLNCLIFLIDYSIVQLHDVNFYIIHYQWPNNCEDKLYFFVCLFLFVRLHTWELMAEPLYIFLRHISKWFFLFTILLCWAQVAPLTAPQHLCKIQMSIFHCSWQFSHAPSSVMRSPVPP